MERTKVAIIGLGTVGTGVAKLLLDHGDRTARHAGRIPWLEKAVVQNLNKPRKVEIPDGVLTDNLDDVISNPEITVVAQLIGGIEPARTIMLQLLEAGKDIITANKALLAIHGPELFDKARQLGRCIAFEASVGGGIPIITNIGQNRLNLSDNPVSANKKRFIRATHSHANAPARFGHALRNITPNKPRPAKYRHAFCHYDRLSDILYALIRPTPVSDKIKSPRHK